MGLIELRCGEEEKEEEEEIGQKEARADGSATDRPV